MTAPITRERLRELLDAYGADAARWPQAEREGARQLLETSATARQLLDEAAIADAELALPAVPAPAIELRAAILVAGPAHKPARDAQGSGWWRDLSAALGGWRLAASALTVSAVLGMWAAVQFNVASSEPDLLEVAQLQANDLEN